MAQKLTTPPIKATTQKIPVAKLRKPTFETSRIFLDVDELARRRQTAPLSRYVE